MNELTEKRTPELIGSEIRMYVDAGRRMSLLCGIEIGRRLAEAKAMLEHGEWLPWLERETEFSDRSAARYMKLFEEYGASQMGLFGPETNSPTLSNLPISKAFALLSVPESDREAFAEEVDAEHISVRELQQAIEEKKAAEERARQAEKALDAARNEQEGTDLALADAREKITELTKLNKELENRPHEVAVERDEAAIAAAAKEAREQAEREAERAQDGLKKQLTEAEKKQKNLQDALKQAETKLTAKEAELTGLQNRQAMEIDRATAKLQKQLEEAQKQLKTANPFVTEFKVHFEAMQADADAVLKVWKKILAADQETGEKLRNALRALVEYVRTETGLED